MCKYVIISVLVFSVFFTGCQKIKIDYVGQNDPKTKFAKLYFGKNEVNKPYKVIGKAIIRASTSFSSVDIQKKLRRTAEAKGADAVIILSYKEVPAGMYAYNNYPMWGMYDGMYGWGGMGCMPCNYGPYWGEMNYPGMGGKGEESVQCYYDYLIKTLFVRFKNNDSTEPLLTGKTVKHLKDQGNSGGAMKKFLSEKKYRKSTKKF
ncbi:MAG: hypothetical protein K9M56_01530 [Victivallales bacterium]|nr:hypothetical protein [Victivallales bacterium]